MYTEGKSVFQMHLIFLLTQVGQKKSLPKKSLHYSPKQPIKAVIRLSTIPFPPPLYSSSVLSLSLCLLKGLST